MKATFARRTAATAIAVGALVSGMAHGAGMAGADTINEHHPETPKLNPDLPIVNTYRGSDGLKANILNPHPVCNSGEDYRTVVYKVTDDFTPAGTISATNDTNKTIPLAQDLSKEQSISISVKGDRTEKTDVNLGGDAKGDKGGGSVGIAYSLAQTMGVEASYSLSWNVGQSIGPYDVPAGHTGEATYGFRTINMTGTQQFCKPNGTWSTPTAWSALTPIKNQVNVKLYDNPAGAAEGAPKPEAIEEKPADDAANNGDDEKPATDEKPAADDNSNEETAEA